MTVINSHFCHFLYINLLKIDMFKVRKCYFIYPLLFVTNIRFANIEHVLDLILFTVNLKQIRVLTFYRILPGVSYVINQFLKPKTCKFVS